MAKGQTIELPAGQFNRVYILAASADGDQKAKFRVGDQAVELNIQDWSGFIGQWDTRRLEELPVARLGDLGEPRGVAAAMLRSGSSARPNRVSRGLCRLDARVCEACRPRLVCFASSHG